MNLLFYLPRCTDCGFRCSQSLLLSLSRQQLVPVRLVHISLKRVLYASYSTWMAVYHIDLVPYKSHLEQVRNHATDISTLIKNLNMSQYRGLEEYDSMMHMHWKLIDIIDQETEMFEFEIFEAINMLTELDLLIAKPENKNRAKRSLVPMVGKGLSWLFGLVTESKARKISKQIDSLKESQKVMIHAVNESMTILDATVQEVDV